MGKIATGGRRLPKAIAAALDDMCQDMERFQVRQERRKLLTRCIAAADELIGELEDLGMAGDDPVPARWQPRLDRFTGSLPPDVAGELRCGTRPTRLLDEVFAIEERLYRLKLGEWALAFELPDREAG